MGDIPSSRRKIFWFSVFSFIAIIFILLFVSVLVSCFFFSDKSEADTEREARVYRYLRLNSKTNETSNGFVTMYKDLKDDEYIYEENAGFQVLISTFGSDEYQCTGTCYCDDDSQRKHAAMVSHVTRVLVYLVAAISSFLAIEKAGEYLSEECQKELGDSCEMSMIRSEVNNCENTNSNVELATQPPKRRHIRKYFCHGNCLTAKLRNPKTVKMASEFGCEDLKVEGEVEVECPPSKNGGICQTYARSYFQRDHLVGFCKENSNEKYTYYWPGGMNRHCFKVVNLCVGNHRGPVNPTIRCSMCRNRKCYR